MSTSKVKGWQLHAPVTGECYSSSLEKHNELAGRLRRAERQHAIDKAEWKLKLEGALASARRVSEEAEEIRTMYNTLKENHEKAVRTHKEERRRLEINSQESEREFRKAIAEVQKDLKNQISDLAVENKMLQTSAKEQVVTHKSAIEELTSKNKKEKDEMVAKLNAQRSQIEQLKGANKSALELCEQLSEEQKKYAKEQRQAQSSQQSNSIEIAFLREELESMKKKEKEFIEKTQGKIESLKEKLEGSKNREQAVVMSMVELQNKLKEHALIIQDQDDQLHAWAATATKLERCLKGVMHLESRSNETLPEYVDGLIDALKRYFSDSSDQTDHLAVSCSQLRNEVAAWKCQFDDLERTLASLKKISSKDQKVIEELQASRKDMETALKKKQNEVMEWESSYSKIERCVEDLMQLENETSEGYQEKINFLVMKNQNLEQKLESLEKKCKDLTSENAGLRVDNELGLEAVLSGNVTTKRAGTPVTQDDEESIDVSLNK